jgi:hypothetical protein
MLAAALAAPPPALVAAPLLDARKGASAARAFGAYVRQQCPPSAPASTIPANGDADTSAAWPCGLGDSAATPIACGSFSAPGADEVVLVAANGLDWAAGDQTLVVMRDAGKGYRYAGTSGKGHGFVAQTRIQVAGARDALFLCDRSGHQGLYPSRCGFLGEGTFGASPDHARDDELALLTNEACGPSASVLLGKVGVSGSDLTVELVVETSVREQLLDEDTTSGCSKQTKVTRRSYTLAYRFDGTRFRRRAPVPAEVRRIAERY